MWATPLFTFFPICPWASPAKFIWWTLVTTSSGLRPRASSRAGSARRTRTSNMKAIHGLGLSVVSVSLIALTAPAFASWEDVASPYDVQRLGRLTEARAKGEDAAHMGRIERDAGAVHAAFSGGSHPMSRGELVGSWRCRTAKSGGILPPIGYGWFHCRVSERDGHLFFQKLNGTQRVAGYLYPHQSGGYVLLGAWSVKG